LSVNVPASLGARKDRGGYIGLGVYCSAHCLSKDIARLDRVEQERRELYEAEAPSYAR
jgi:hypothetical protein